MKKHFTLIKIVTVFAFISAIVGFFSLHRDINPFIKEAVAAENKKDRLFRKMGIQPIPHIAETIDFTLKDLDGNPVRLSDFRGKIVFLNFWATWCPECRIEMPSMQKLHSRFKDKSFAMVSVNMKESASEVKKFFKKYKLTFIGLLDSDGEAGSQMGIRAIPTTFILNKNGKIAGTIMGAREWDSKASIALFEHLINLKEDPSS